MVFSQERERDTEANLPRVAASPARSKPRLVWLVLLAIALGVALVVIVVLILLAIAQG